MDEDRIEKALDKGEDAFWAAIAAQFPEAVTGDLSPDMVLTLRRTMERAVREWVNANVGADLSLAD
jgi:hypothetical protein